jgi:hypothetical protein
LALRGLLIGEARLTLSLIAGALAGELMVRYRVTDRVFRPVERLVRRLRVNPQAISAMTVSVASPRVGAAMLASAHSRGEITQEDAVFGTLCLAFPAYVKRWLVTAPMAAALAGPLGVLYSSVLIFRSAARFLLCLHLLRRRGSGGSSPAVDDPAEGRTATASEGRFLRQGLRSLPLAWIFFGVTYWAMPAVEAWALDNLRWLVSPSGLTVVTSALAHSTASLASAKGALEAGSLSLPGALLALLMGNALGTFTRVLRQNVGYWVGIFPGEVLRPLGIWHLGTLLLFEALSIGLVLLWWGWSR